MRIVPRWALLSSGCAPVLFIAGWTIAASLEGPAYDPLTRTISVLAAHGSPGYWVMTGALLALGVCHLLTAWALRAAAPVGRLALGGGGVAAFLVVLVPAPSSGGSLRHGSVAVVGFTLLALWPVLAARGGPGTAWALRPGPALTATVVMAAGGAWFMVEMQRHGAAGLAERVVTCTQSGWPFVVVVSCVARRANRCARRAEKEPVGQARSHR